MNAVRRWRPLLRIAWRDAARHRARSALVLVLIALPVLAVTAADVLYQTAEISGSEALERRLGAADARISVNDYTVKVLQEPDPDRGMGASEGGEDTRAPTLEELSAALGRPLRALEWRTGEMRVEVDRGVSPVEASELDLRDPLAQGLVALDRGRLPIDDDEVLVNGDLAARGPGLGETLQVVDGRALRVVGVGESTSVVGAPLVFALPGTAMPEASGDLHTWLVDAGGPVTWADVLRLNGVGATVLSREVLRHPPAESEIPEEVRQIGGGDSQGLAILALVVAMVLLEVVLLAGPAFAVGARRQSRNLALMAATGGTPPQARRTILASALVLGTTGAVVGVTAGLAVAWAGQPLLQRFTTTVLGPYDVPWLHLLGVAGFGLVSALLAAVVPAWIASQQDVVAVLAGRRGDRRAGIRSPLLGVRLLAAGVAGSAYGARAEGNGELMIAFAAIVAVLGMILLVPVLLVVLARVSRLLPLALRFAVRDAARHRTRTVPAVAAVAATVAGVVALGIANSSDARQDRETYRPTLPDGDGVVAAYDATAQDWPAIRGVLRSEVPEATVTDVLGVAEGSSGASASLRFKVGGRRDFLYAYGGSLGASVLVSPALTGVPGLPADRVAAADAALRAGGAVLFANEAIDADAVTVSGRLYDGDGRPAGKVPRQSVPALVVRVPMDAAVPQAVLSPGLAQRLELPVSTVGLYLTGGEIGRDQQRNASEAVAAIVPYASHYVERGYEGDEATRIVLLILAALGGVLMLGGTLTATYLALSDARPDLATLGAVGAAPRARRAVAGSYAVVVGLVGAVVGSLVGFIPGIAVAFPLTTTGGETYTAPAGVSGVNVVESPSVGPFIDVPWLMIGVLVLALPLVTALVVSLTTRSRLPMVARLD